MSDPPLSLTASQTVGPYLTIGLIRELVVPELVDRADPRAVVIRGTLFDGEGEVVPDGMIEIWQANAGGRYASELDVRGDVALEEGFLGFGRSSTVDGGAFEFVTLKPGQVPWPHGGLQAPHLVVGIFARGMLKRLVTRMYFPDETEANAADPVLSGLDEAARATLVARETEGGVLQFDIRLQGPGQTTFFAV